MGYVNCQPYTISSCFAVECQINVKLTRYIGVGVIIFSIIRHPRLPPIFTVSPKVADNRGKTVYDSYSYPNYEYIFRIMIITVLKFGCESSKPTRPLALFSPFHNLDRRVCRPSRPHFNPSPGGFHNPRMSNVMY